MGLYWLGVPRGAAGSAYLMSDAIALAETRQDARPLVDPFARAITYLRVSVTDRCDFRCVYCMSEDMTFLPKRDLLTLEELDRLCSAFVARGVKKLRVTGGEPLVRRDIMILFRSLSRHSKTGALDELTVTTNGSQLSRFAGELVDCGVRRINVSLDTLDPKNSTASRVGAILPRCSRESTPPRTPGSRQDQRRRPEGRERGRDPIADRMGAWARHRPLPDRSNAARRDRGRARRPVSAAVGRAGAPLRATRSTDIEYSTGGPARYVRVKETGGKLGFITPLTHNFCESCNRVRVTCTGKLYMCLGQEDAADLRTPIRASEGDERLEAAIEEAIARKPKGHDFIIDRRTTALPVAPHEHDRRLSHDPRSGARLPDFG